MFVISITSVFFNFFNSGVRFSKTDFDNKILQKTTGNVKLPNVYYIIADGLTGPINYKRLTKESLSFFSDTMTKFNFIELKNSKSNYISSFKYRKYFSFEIL